MCGGGGGAFELFIVYVAIEQESTYRVNNIYVLIEHVHIMIAEL